RLGPPAWTEDEGERPVVADLLHHLEGLLEVRVGLAGKADDQICRQGEVRDGRAQFGDEGQVTIATVGAPHRLEDAARARLEGQVSVLANGRASSHGRDDRLAKVLGVWTHESDALDAGDAVHGVEKLAELGADLG